MTIYWRLNDIPELRSVPVAQRRQLWREAVTRSFAVRFLLARLAAAILGAGLLAGLGLLLWPTRQVWFLLAMLGMVLGGVITDHVACSRVRGAGCASTQASWIAIHPGDRLLIGYGCL